jgi:23S rRNA (adenine-N6)-dimethyltransferase
MPPRRRSPHPDRPPIGGPHELGQNWLVDRRFPAEMAEILRHAPPHPIVELAAGNGAITEVMLEVGSPITAVELDPRQVTRLRQRFGTRAEIVEADMLTFAFPSTPHHVVANVPFSVTTPFLRRLLRQPRWDTAVLLLQWEVARKRAGVGGTTLLTASWWPWFSFELGSRVPARAFAPVPTVDGGILIVRRRHDPLIRPDERSAYQALVRQVFTGRGRGLPGILRECIPEREARRWMVQQHIGGRTLPRDLKAEDWISLFHLVTVTTTRGGRRTPPGRRLPPT